MPAKAGIQNYLKTLDSRLRGNDAKGRFKTFYEAINVGNWMMNVKLRKSIDFNFYKKTEQSNSIIRHSSFDIRHSYQGGNNGKR